MDKQENIERLRELAQLAQEAFDYYQGKVSSAQLDLDRLEIELEDAEGDFNE